jgi:hypothetical protein
MLMNLQMLKRPASANRPRIPRCSPHSSRVNGFSDRELRVVPATTPEAGSGRCPRRFIRTHDGPRLAVAVDAAKIPAATCRPAPKPSMMCYGEGRSMEHLWSCIDLTAP